MAKTPRCAHHLGGLYVTQENHPLFVLRTVLYDGCYSKNNKKPERHEGVVDM